ncbi:hypothetical protein BGZ67_005084 [Mortierella alpina]|nr:hypothetical protein BGZ67_005084 [Mortierella alpina]
MSYGQPYRQKSILETYIERACDPSRYEPDLALNLEICDVIKEKQKNTPREAAIYIVRLVNNKNMHVGMLALTLLDNCVKNCGYPFHLQIATKEFLNALVRRFPERPLTVPTPVQTRILELIQEWYTTLCKTSRYKEDLVHIRDMHRLLNFKGYRFPQTKKSAAAVLNPVDSLKSPAELEEEDRVAQAAKLQELIRRGRPEDVRAANELVKRMTGYEQEQKPDYVEQASAELEKLLQKATLLTEMLNDVKPGEIIGRGDIFEDLFGTCKAAQPKIQRFISENEDPENMDKLLELNDILNNVVEQYEQVKNGNLVKVDLPNGSDSESHARNDRQQVSTPTLKESSLIDLLDFDGSSSNGSPTAATTPKTTGNLMDDLMNLSFNETPPPPSWGAAGSINLGQPSNGAPLSPPSSSKSNGGGLNYNMFSAPVASVNPVSVGSSSSTATSSQPLNASPFDEFEFISNTGATPQERGPITVELLNKNGLQIDLDIEKQVESEKVFKLTAYFSNQQNSAISALTFRVAVPKNLQLKLDPQSAQTVAPFSRSELLAASLFNPVSCHSPRSLRFAMAAAPAPSSDPKPFSLSRFQYNSVEVAGMVFPSNETAHIYHPHYDDKRNANDIGLVFLLKKLPGPYPQISSDYPQPDSKIMAAGFGDVDNNGTETDVLRKVELTVEAKSVCLAKDNTFLSDTEFCTRDTPQSTCVGDSGGPLFVGEKENIKIVGITSHGVKKDACGLEGNYQYYTFVYPHMQWINDEIARFEKNGTVSTLQNS